MIGASALTLIGTVAVPGIAHSDQTTYPIGVVSSSEPSGYAPPAANALPGFSLSYSTDFTGTSLPSGWDAFTGTSTGDPGSQWASSQAVVSGGMLQLNAAQNSGGWVDGGVSQSSSQTYGAYFVRSRETGAGPTIVELLWPTSGWPPEIDFNETSGVTTGSTATNIWGVDSNGNKSQSQVAVSIDMTQWHTWGVIWTPTSITYTVDGQVWGTFTTPSEIPSQPMSIHIQQQTWCSSGFACPTAPESTDVDWVAEYTPSSGSSNPPTTTTTAANSSPPVTTTTTTSPPPVAPAPPAPPATTTTTTAPPETHPAASNVVTLTSFASDSSALSHALKLKIARLATRIRENDDDAVTLTGYCTDNVDPSVDLGIARKRAQKVEVFLRSRLIRIGDPRVKIRARGAISQGATVTARLKSHSVVALLR